MFFCGGFLLPAEINGINREAENKMRGGMAAEKKKNRQTGGLIMIAHGYIPACSRPG